MLKFLKIVEVFGKEKGLLLNFTISHVMNAHECLVQKDIHNFLKNPN
jgi:hypothetical protein